MTLTIDALFTTPDHYFHSFDGNGAIFMPMDRAAYHRSIFLDRRISAAADQTMVLPIASLAKHIPPPAPTAWIFHMAHCGSTLLARALDDPDTSLVLREPLALRQTAIQYDDTRLGLVLAMLGKRYRKDAPTLVKANVPVNFLLPLIAAAELKARAILLYLPLRAYLLAILRNEAHRTWLRNVTGQLAQHIGDLSLASDADRAAALWHTQIRAFAKALDKMPNARALDAELFFAKPVAVLQAAARHLDIPFNNAALERTVAGPLFSTYSKNPSLTFDNATRVARIAAVEAEMAPEIATAEAWVTRQARSSSFEASVIKAALIR